MKKSYFLGCMAVMLGISFGMQAQVAPATENLTHQWTFDDGTTNDLIGGVNGVIEGNAVVENKALNAAGGGYLTLDGAALALNSYNEVSIETWFTSVASANPSYHMLWYFGGTFEGHGINYLCMTPARGNNVSRAMLRHGDVNGNGGVEEGVNGPEYDDGILHHVVASVTQSTITYYVDGMNMGTADLSAADCISGLSTELAWLGKGGYTADPTWKGKYHKVSVFNKALSDENVMFLYQQGAEESPVLSVSKEKLAFDTNYPAEMLTVNSSNLSADITITAPDGIFIDPTTISKDSKTADLVVYYDGETTVNDTIRLTSGTMTVKIPVRAVSDAECFQPLYPDNINLISDPGLNNLASFRGWGTKSVSNLVTDPDNVYCGAASICVGSGELNTGGGTGSLDFPLDGMLYPSTTYRVKVAGKTDGQFRLGIERYDSQGSVYLQKMNTSGEWQIFDFTFTTGPVVPSNPVIYINNWSETGTIAYFDNWEIYAMPDAVVNTDKDYLGFDPQFTVDSFHVSGGNLTGAISLTAPAGVSLSLSTLAADATNANVIVTYDGTSAVEGEILIESSGVQKTVKVKSAGSNQNCFVPMFTDRPNLIPDPFFNSMKNFNGWGTKSCVTVAEMPDSVWCGSHSGLMYNASFDVPLADKLVASYNYIARIMVKTIGGSYQMGVARYDDQASGDYQDTIDTKGVWQQWEFKFHTGQTFPADPVIFFNNFQRSGKMAFLDNWELYQDTEYTAVENPNDSFNNVFVRDGKIQLAFEAASANAAHLTVYALQGTQVYNEMIPVQSGANLHAVNKLLPAGIYLVKLQLDGQTSVRKIAL